MRPDRQTVLAFRSKEAFEPVASMIWQQDGPPEWLVDTISSWASGLTLSRAVDFFQPTRVKLLKEIEALFYASDTLQKSYKSNPIREFLALSKVSPANERDFLETLNELKTRASDLLKDPSLVNSEGKANPGRSRPLPAGGAVAKVSYACFVTEAWLFCRGKRAGARNEVARKAAQKLWEITGGDRDGWSNSLEGWRKYFEMANEPSQEDYRAEIRRHLTLARSVSKGHGPNPSEG